jgi:hypothetical protein
MRSALAKQGEFGVIPEVPIAEDDIVGFAAGEPSAQEVNFSDRQGVHKQVEQGPAGPARRAEQSRRGKPAPRFSLGGLRKPALQRRGVGHAHRRAVDDTDPVSASQTIRLVQILH